MYEYGILCVSILEETIAELGHLGGVDEFT